MSIKISDKHKKIVTDILRLILDEKTAVYVFGSRSKDTQKEYADLDLAIKSEYKIPQLILDKLHSEFENSLLPYKVDIVDLNDIDSDFYSCIKDDLKRLI